MQRRDFDFWVSIVVIILGFSSLTFRRGSEVSQEKSSEQFLEGCCCTDKRLVCEVVRFAASALLDVRVAVGAETCPPEKNSSSMSPSDEDHIKLAIRCRCRQLGHVATGVLQGFDARNPVPRLQISSFLSSRSFCVAGFERLIYILAAGSDPMADIQKLAEGSCPCIWTICLYSFGQSNKAGWICWQRSIPSVWDRDRVQRLAVRLQRSQLSIPLRHTCAGDRRNQRGLAVW